MRARIDAAAAAAGRRSADITIVAASKTRTPEEVAAAHDAGIHIFGENRVQEWRAKHAACPPSVLWHLIGPLQRNKARAATGAFALIQAVDRIELARAISAAAVAKGVVQPILLEVNVSHESSKHGVSPEEAVDASRSLARLENLRLDGLMTVGDPSEPRPGFELLADLGTRIRHFVPSAVHLSMGMSADLEAAVEAGATIVRPGTALFGLRPAMP